MNELNERQKRFVDFYCLTASPVEAARRAGYKHPNVQCARLMKIPAVKAALDERLYEMERERIATLNELNAFWTDVIRDAMAETRDRLKASELRGKVLGAFVERREVDVSADMGKFSKLLESMGVAE